MTTLRMCGSCAHHRNTRGLLRRVWGPSERGCTRLADLAIKEYIVVGLDETAGSGLEIASRCPRCGPRSTLREVSNSLGESSCKLCGGSHLPAFGFDQILIKVTGRSRRDLQASPPSPRRGATLCPSCDGATESISLKGGSADFCRRCGSAWFDGNVLFSVSSGQFGARTNRSPLFGRSGRRAPAVMPARRRGLKLFFGALATVALGGATHLLYPFILEAVQAQSTARTEAGPAGSAEAPTPSTAELVRNYPFGGQKPEWWARRLEALKGESGARAEARYALTKARARANGLEVDDSGATIVVSPSPELLAQIGRRLEKK